jgi:hypothetical protein
LLATECAEPGVASGSQRGYFLDVRCYLRKIALA